MSLIFPAAFLCFFAYYFLQCYYWNRYKWSVLSKIMKQKVCAVEGKRISWRELDLSFGVFNLCIWIVRFNANKFTVQRSAWVTPIDFTSESEL